MIDIILSILLITYLGVAFSIFPKYSIHTFQAIVINYWTCVVTGIIVSGVTPSILGKYSATNEFSYAVLIGSIFIFGFYLMAKTIEVFGLSLAIVTQRMTLLVSTIFAILYFGEAISIIKIIGIFLAILALILTNYVAKKDRVSFQWKSVLFPISVFILVATGDSILMYVERSILSESGDPRFVISVFGIAASVGTLFLGMHFMHKKIFFDLKSIIAGIILGIPNYFSLYFTMRALGSGYESSVVFPIINIAVIVLSAIIGLFVFKNKLSKVNQIGVLIAVLSIIAISFSKY